MSSLATLARPYAKAAFQLAEGDLASWDDMLALASGIASDDYVVALLDSPHVSAQRIIQLFTDTAGDRFDSRFTGYLTVLADNGRLSLLPEVAELYGRLRQDAEKRLQVRVVSAVPLDDDQASRMREALARRFEREVELETEIDPGVIGGAVIYAGDQAIDGSLRGRLRKLEQSLAV